MSRFTAPASFAQERLWFLEQMGTVGQAYHVMSAYRLEGLLDRAALERSVTAVIARHEALRTTFESVDGRLIQVLHPPHPLAFRRVDLAGLDAVAQEAALRDHVALEAGTPFDLTRGPLVRGRLVRLADTRHVVLFTLHHVIADAWSMALLIREIGDAYAAYASGTAPKWPPLPVQYADYAAWQRDRLQGDVLERELDYWRGQLAGAPEGVELPTDRPRPAVQSYRGGRVDFQIPSDVVEALHEVSRDVGASPFMTLLAVFNVLLARYTRQTDVVVGSPIANRTRAETEALIGFFVNTLVLRTRLHRHSTFRELLRHVRDVCLDAYAHQALPFERLVEALAPDRDLSRAPLFQILFVLQNIPLPSVELAGLRLSPLPLPCTTSKFDLTCTLIETTSGLSGGMEYSTDLFDEETIAQLARHYVALARAAARAPETETWALPMIDTDERRLLVEGWNETEQPVREGGVVSLFEEQVARTPDAVAVALGSRELSYTELDVRAKRAASRLRQLGIGPDTPVGILAYRSIDTFVAILGTLGAGGAYLPLDPSYPADRLSFMVSDSGAPVVVAPRDAPLPALPPGVSVVAVEDLCSATTSDEQDGDDFVAVDADHLAYIIYTSGSTGRPKGVALPHGPLVALTCWQLRVAPPQPAARTLQFSSLGFDASIQEMLTTWASGGTLVLVSEETRRDPEALLAFLDATRIHRWFCPFVALRALVEQAERRPDVTLQLREVCTAGEALEITPEVVRFFARHPACTLYNFYGPSETHVVTAHRLAEPPAAWPPLPPIGRAIDNTRAYVLDGRLNPVPLGVPAELYIGGLPLARGYIGKPDLTAERFLPDPFTWVAGGRMYCTGDLARRTREGVIEFLGRADEQVKIRGFRVEPGEIEAVLARHPSVGQAVVVASADDGQKRLIAYVVSSGPDERVSDQELRAFLREHLPDYMVPSGIVTISALPRTAGGKVDRRALPAPSATVIERAGSVPPRDGTEEALGHIFGDVLGVARVGVHDNFFELGGHSLLATQLLARVRQVFDVDVPVRAVFEDPTVSGLAARVQASRAAGLTSAAPALRRRAVAGPAPLSSAQERLWLLEQMGVVGSAYHLMHALRLDGRLDVEALERSVNAVIARHEALRTTFEAVDGRAVQVVRAPYVFQFVQVDLSALDARTQEVALREHAAAEARLPFDLSCGPLVRGRLIRLGETAHVVFLTLHHIVSDGWSIGVLIREIGEGYQAYAAGGAPRWNPLPVQYPDYAVWHRDWLQGETLEAELSYWRTQLANGPTEVALPVDRPRPSVSGGRGGRIDFHIAGDVAQALRGVCRQAGATLFMTLLAAFKVLLARYTGQTDLVVGSPIANRTQAETEGLIGFFVNTLVLRTRWSGDATFLEVLQAVKETCLGAYAHQSLPFERLVEALAPGRDLSRTPLFQIMFLLQNMPMPPLALADVRIAPGPPEVETTKFDLTLALTETGDGVRGAMEYSRDLFDEATIVNMAERFTRVVQAVAADPHQRISTLPILAAHERQQLASWNAARQVVPSTSVVGLIKAHAAQTPDRLAVEQGTRRLTYAELDRRTSKLAGALRRYGVTAESRVAVCLDVSPDLVVVLFAILKAGGAFVPLDVADPPGRRAKLISRSGSSLLVTSSAHRSADDELPGASVLLVDRLDEWPDAVARDVADESFEADTDRLAYVIYTSGSTGDPKGVMVTRGSLLTYLTWVNQVVLRGRRVAATTNPTFDASLKQLLGPLLAGGTVWIPSAGRDLTGLPEEWRRTPDTVLNGVPSVWDALLRQLEDDPAHPSPTAILLGGDAPPASLLDRTWRRLPNAEIWNLYGPTEATANASADRCEPGGHITIGKPAAGARLFVLDRWMQPLPVNVPGELYIAGGGLARGYLDAPGLTAERFLPNPMGNGDRMYRTGDRACLRPDGRVEFLGRVDTQVKVRGFRVELREIATALEAQPGVLQAMAVPVERRGRVQLVAYVVPDVNGAATPETLRDKLAALLPQYMVPSRVFIVGGLPTGRHGKVDQQALQELATRRDQELHEDGNSGANATEEALLRIWRELLGRQNVGRHDNFFEIGGDSILSIQIVARSRQVGLQLSPRDLFEHQTVAELARVLESAEGATRLEQPRAGAPRSYSSALTPIQRWFLHRNLPEAHHYNHAIWITLSHGFEAETWASVIRALADAHDALRSTFQPSGETWSARIGDRLAEDALQIIDASRFSGNALAREHEVRASEWQTRFDLTAGPLLRVLVFDAGANHRCRVCFIAHHLIVDAVSWRVLIDDLGTLLADVEQGRPISLPPEPTSVRDWVDRLHAAMETTDVEAAARRWRERLRPDELRPLPCDAERESNLVASGHSVTGSLSPEQTKALLERAGQANVSIEAALLTALAGSVGRWSGSETVQVDIERHGREPAFALDLSRTVGWLTAIVPIRCSMSARDFWTAARAVQREIEESTREAVSYAFLRHAHPDPAVREQFASLPSSQILFNYLGTASEGTVRAPIVDWTVGHSGMLQAPTTPRTHLLELTAGQRRGELHLGWTYNERRHHRSTIVRLQSLVQAALSDAAQDATARRLTAADFPLAGLTEEQLDAIQTRWSQGPTNSSPVRETR